MPEWWTYSLSDFLLFSPRTYYRLIERHNLAVWPAQLLAFVLGLAIAFLLLQPTRARGQHHLHQPRHHEAPLGYAGLLGEIVGAGDQPGKARGAVSPQFGDRADVEHGARRLDHCP